MAELIDRWLVGRFRLVVSEHILAEVERAWTKSYWQTRFGQSHIDRALALLRQDAELVSLSATVEGVATHPADDMILATAVSAEVDYLATGDRQLQALGQYKGVIILSPRDFLTVLDEQPNETEDETSEIKEGETIDGSAS